MLVVVDPTVLSAHLGLLAGTTARVGSAALQITGALASLAERADHALGSSRARLATAIHTRTRAEEAVRRAESDLDHAGQEVTWARAALARAEATTWRDDDGTVRHADTTAEIAAVAQAEARHAAARKELVRVQEELERALAAQLEAERRARFAATVRGRAFDQVERAGAVAGWIGLFQELATDASFLLTLRIDLLAQYLGDLPARVAQARAGAAAGGGIAAAVLGALVPGAGVVAAGVAPFDVGAGDGVGVGGAAQGLTDLSSGFGAGVLALATCWADDVGRRYFVGFAEPLADRMRGIAEAARDISTSTHGIEHDLDRLGRPEPFDDERGTTDG
ncbi:hypothetical protein [Frankia sp. AiPa1]|uniref:hypothetical protein n=1 Tax=Frankia sp. AiPa1 TaxID=573492 RepID=UPI00202B7223|nr:hypothetical protein [Frankia sp. AiPa1]MCL9758034.1 hypothetical protein [Frankia sp. AiPa1]